MRRLVIFFLAVVLAATSMAQPPQKISYQAVVRDDIGDLVTNQNIGIRISILDDIEGVTLWTEEQNAATNENGLLSIEIGSINPIDYELIYQYSPLYIKTELDLQGGIEYTITGTSQLLSVPYALHAYSAETIVGELSETDPVFSAWDKDYDDLTNKPSSISDFILDANDNIITNLADPINDKDAVNKDYLESVVEELLIQLQHLQNQINCMPFFDSRDGNYYQTVLIGDQCWMAENLRYLPSVAAPGTHSYTTPYYYVYDYNGTDVSAAKATNNYNTYGVLYNWEAANTACPDGWHLPSDDEIKELEMSLGMSQEEADGQYYRGTNEGSKMGGGFDLWQNGDLINNVEFGTSGFSLTPGGVYYHGSSIFMEIGNMSFIWSSTETYFSTYSRSIYYDETRSYRSLDEVINAGSVRCVKF